MPRLQQYLQYSLKTAELKKIQFVLESVENNVTRRRYTGSPPIQLYFQSPIYTVKLKHGCLSDT